MQTQDAGIADAERQHPDALERRAMVEWGTPGCNAEAPIDFGCFRVVPGARLLLRDGAPVDLGSRAFDLLVVLLKARGAIVPKDQIMKHVWPSTVVEDSNLRFQMTALRKALGRHRDMIKTIPGRGYLLATEFGADSAEPHARRDVDLALEQGGPRPSHTAGGEERLPGQPHKGKRPTVAIIDDDGNIREALQGLVRSIGLQADSFASVRAFLDRAQPSLPECLILDVWLPGRSGLDFQADLMEAGMKLPVIFISGHADVHTCVRAMRAGAFDFLTKPVRHQELLDTIKLAIMPRPGDITLPMAPRPP